MCYKKIKQVSTELNISESAIQYYEHLGLLKPLRTDGNYRNFSSDDILKLKMILILKDSGFALKEIKILLVEDTKNIGENSDENCKKANELLHNKILSLEKQVDKTNQYLLLFRKYMLLIDQSEDKKNEVVNFIELLFEKIKN